jgi:PPOX class probable F420-dependent enzyme
VRTGITIDGLDGFLDEPVVAVLATIRSDGSVLLSPVWHEWRDGGFNVWVGGKDVKAEHLRRDPRATIVVAESRPPLRGVEVRTEARLIREDAVGTAIRIGGRYIGQERADSYVRSFSDDQLTVRLVPGTLRIWDFADEYGGGKFAEPT